MSLNSKERQALFLELARRPEGVTAQDAFEVGQARGDDVSKEAYFNLARRLSHRGIVRADRSSERTVYSTKLDENTTWLEEDQLAAMIDPEYPILGLTAFREAQRQAREIPDSAWIQARRKLQEADARELAFEAITGYADNLLDEIEAYGSDRLRGGNTPDLPTTKRRAEANLQLLEGLCKNGLGLSDEAIKLPVSVDTATEAFLRSGRPALYDTELLRDELARRIEPGPLLRIAEARPRTQPLMLAGVDGSSVGGLLSLDGAGGDFAFGHAPQVSINTATSVLDRYIRVGSTTVPAFLRLPEKPEDMQQQNNRYTIMAKMFYPDLTDSEYVHSTWNAMDLLECRATLAVLKRWTWVPGNLEIPSVDVVLRDGTVVPNDRDANHYGQQNTYGRIVRDLIEASWNIAQICRDDGKTVMGVVKNAQMRVLVPIVNHHLCQLAARSDDASIDYWSLSDMNTLFDQALMTRLLTAGRQQGDPWLRSALILRPFHATSNLGKSSSRARGDRPHDRLIRRSDAARQKPLEELTAEDDWWRTLRVPGDPYVHMLRNVWYAGFYVAATPRLDRSEQLPRMEFVAVHPTEESGAFPEEVVTVHLDNCIAALRQGSFDVAKEHAMFDDAGHIDLLPTVLVRAHDTVKTWAKELRDRVSEYMDWHLAKYLSAGQKRAVRLRPWKRRELEAWVDAMQQERRQIGGGDHRS